MSGDAEAARSTGEAIASEDDAAEPSQASESVGEAEAAAPQPPKMDPQALVLRGRPGRVVRFRRDVIVTVAALGSTALVGVTWIALRPAALQIIAGADSAQDVASKPPGDALAGAPRSYGDVPKLGPPLPGDLGRPILRQQQRIEELPQQTGRDTAADQAQAEQQRVAAERKSARESAVLVQISSTAHPSVIAAPVPVPVGVPQEADNKI